MDKKRLEYYKKKLLARREELLKTISRTEEEGRTADDDPTVDLADKAANSYTKEFLFGQTNTDRSMLQLNRRGAPAHQGRNIRFVHELRSRVATEASSEAVPWASTASRARRSTSKGLALKRLPPPLERASRFFWAPVFPFFARSLFLRRSL